MMLNIFTKAVSEIVWADIEQIVAAGAEESFELEFKEALPVKDGQVPGSKGFSPFGRDKLAEELVAFANAHGGTLIVGIAEESGPLPKAKAISPVADCLALAQKLEAALRSVIDPPIASLACAAVTDGENQAGVIVLRVASSTIAPHGVGEPARAYIRRGTSCSPMRMGELQSRFWEARTGSERVVARRTEESEKLRAIRERVAKKGFPEERNMWAIEAGTKGAYFRCTAIPQTSIGLGYINAQHDWLRDLWPYVSIHEGSGTAFERPGVQDGWIPRAHGVFARSNSASQWTILDDGSVSVAGLVDHSETKFAPDWLVLTAWQVMVMAERLRTRAGRPDAAIEFDCEIIIDEGIGVHVGREGVRSSRHRPLPQSQIGPFSWARRADILAVFRSVEQQIWSACALTQYRSAPYSFEAVFEPKAWAGEE